MKYRTVVGYPADIDNKIQDFLDDGWELYGDPFTVRETWESNSFNTDENKVVMHEDKIAQCLIKKEYDLKDRLS